MNVSARVFVWIFGLILLAVSFSFAQEKIRTVEHKRFIHDNEPVQIVSRELGEKPFIDDTRVLGDREWLNHLRLGIKNVSSKNIISFDLDLVVEKQGKVLLGIPIFFRALSKADAEDDETNKEIKKQKFLRPGEVVKVKVRSRDMLLFGEELKKHGIDDVERVTVDIRFVYFDDGTRWVMGRDSSRSYSRRIHTAFC